MPKRTVFSLVGKIPPLSDSQKSALKNNLCKALLIALKDRGALTDSQLTDALEYLVQEEGNQLS
ncbi:MAG: hypothetical protein IJD21_01515 [Oscillospiraceae bacterium]|nr:hypothetical protein [Oscillospiraceae bacterium]